TFVFEALTRTSSSPSVKLPCRARSITLGLRPPAPTPRGASLRAGGPDDLRERGGVGDREIAQHLAVEADLRLLQAVHQARVRRAVRARGGVDARDPQAAEVALLALAVRVRVNPRLANDFLCVREEARAGAVEAGRVLENAVTAAAGFESSFGAGHGRSPP